MINKIAMIVGAVAIFFAGMFTNYKLTKTPILNCPEINIPKCPPNEPSMKIQTIDVNKLKRLKSFTFAPQYTGNIYLIDEKDTTLINGK